MMKLTTESFQKAADFIKNCATGLDRAMFEYFFENGSKQNVLTELAAYQNNDGGFGSLEYDFELEISSIMATVKAFQYFDRLELDSNNPMVQNGIKYFTDNCNEQRYDWKSVPPEVNDVPHAFWWSYTPPNDRSIVEAMTWEDFVSEYNPNTNSEIVAYLIKYQDLLPDGFPLEAFKKITIDKLFTFTDTIDMHALFCYIKLYEVLSIEDKRFLKDKLCDLIKNSVEPIPDKWKGYVAQPLMFVDSPDSLGADVLKDEIEANLNYLIEAQGEDGAWSPTWSWGGGQYEAAWQRAQIKWKGFITVENLLKLSAFGKLTVG